MKRDLDMKRVIAGAVKYWPISFSSTKEVDMNERTPH